MITLFFYNIFPPNKQKTFRELAFKLTFAQIKFCSPSCFLIDFFSLCLQSKGCLVGMRHTVNLSSNNFQFILQLIYPLLETITNGSRQTSARQDFTALTTTKRTGTNLKSNSIKTTRQDSLLSRNSLLHVQQTLFSAFNYTREDSQFPGSPM